MDEKKGLFDLLDAKQALILGFVAAILTMCTVGFIAFAALYFKGGLPSFGAAQQQPSPTAQQPDQQQQQQPPTPTHADVSPGHFPALGKADAKVTVIEFADFRCPFCERYYNDVGKNLLKDYVNTGKVKFYFRGFAFLGPASTDASEASECANEQGQFWKFHDWLYEHQADESDTAYYSKDNLINYAANLGLNRAKFADCLNGHKYAAKVQEDLTDGQNAGVSGTPTTFVNGDIVVGAVPYARLKTMIDAALAK